MRILYDNYHDKFTEHPSFHIIARKREKEKMFFLVMRMFKIYSLCSFQIYHTAVLTIVIMFYITSPEILFLITEILYLWRSFQSPHSRAPPLVTRSSSMNLAFFFFNSSYKWDYIVFVFLSWLEILNEQKKSLLVVDSW